MTTKQPSPEAGSVNNDDDDSGDYIASSNNIDLATNKNSKISQINFSVDATPSPSSSVLKTTALLLLIPAAPSMPENRLVQIKHQQTEHLGSFGSLENDSPERRQQEEKEEEQLVAEEFTKEEFKNIESMVEVQSDDEMESFQGGDLSCFKDDFHPAPEIPHANVKYLR